jgi:hypothetical protein
MPESTFGLCSGNDGTAHDIERRDVGVDRDYGEVSVLRCLRCGRCWLHYLMEYEYLTAAGRVARGRNPRRRRRQGQARRRTQALRQDGVVLPRGSAYGGQALLSHGTPARWLVPFPVSET